MVKDDEAKTQAEQARNKVFEEAKNAGLDADGKLGQKARSQALTEEDEKRIAENAEEAKKEHREREEASFDNEEELEHYRVIKTIEENYLKDVRKATAEQYKALREMVPEDFEDTKPSKKGFDENRQFNRRLQNRDLITSEAYDNYRNGRRKILLDHGRILKDMGLDGDYPYFAPFSV